MITNNTNVQSIQRINPLGGTGELNGFELVSKEMFNDKLNGFYYNELSVGSEVGFHQHVGNSEVYYLLSGQAQVKDNDDNWVDFKVGDCLYTSDGMWHALKNTGDTKVKFLAFIINS
jgi:mannose-6-phosphate isomerase-like protein (cupin superfamily)